MPVASDPRILVDAATRDDAAVFQMAPDRAIVATVDFFTPIVDDAYDFGRIAAANAFSDVYAMGATPLIALNLVGWPRDTVPLELLGDVLRGGQDIAREAGAFVLGGHSVDDPEPKYGMVAIGEVHPARIVTNAGARPGDALVLTKPIGTGILTTALKRDLLTASGAAAEIQAAAVPLLARARELAERGAIPGGTRRNLESLAGAVEFAAGVDETTRLLLADAQTSGGLLIALPEPQVPALRAALERERAPAAAQVGRVVAGPPGRVAVA